MSKIKVDTLSIFKVALPISFGSFTQFLIVFGDNYFLSKVNLSAFNAAGNSSLLYIAMCMFGMGLGSATQILVARRNGEDQPLEAGKYLKQALLLGILISTGLFAVYHGFISPKLSDWVSNGELASDMRSFLNTRTLGLFIYIPFLIITGFVVGIAKTRIIYLTAGLTAIVNIVLDRILIFDDPFGLQMGLEGAAWASLCAETIALLVILLFVFSKNRFKTFVLTRAWAWRPAISKQLLHLGTPLIFQQLLSMSTWTLFFFLIERLGQNSLALSHIIRNLYMLNLIAIVGFGQCTRTYVSTLLAEKRQSELWPTLRKLIALNLGFVLILAHGAWFYPEVIVGIFSDDLDLIEAGKKVLPIVPLALLIFAVGSIFLNAVEGAGLTRIALGFEIVAVLAYLSYVYYTTSVSPKNLRIVWMSDYIYFGILTALSLLVLLGNKWKYQKL